MDVKVKICGLRSVSHALVALEAGADFLGFVFAPSPRRIGPEEARPILGAVAELRRKTGRSVKTVGVFVNEDPRIVNHIAEVCGLDMVQLSGDEPPENLLEIARPCIRAIRVRDGQSIGEIVGEIDRLEAIARADGKPLGAVLLDSQHPTKYGGTGIAPNWETAAGVARHGPVILAGGLHPGNVAEAIHLVKPWGVDVSTGVETDGAKDPARIRAFIRAAKMAPAPEEPAMEGM